MYDTPEELLREILAGEDSLICGHELGDSHVPEAQLLCNLRLSALDEAGALVPRDYGIAGSQVRVMLLVDRIEISSPGRLPNTLLPEDLFAGCQPVRRNQMLAGFLRDYTSPLTQRAYMEARREGFLTLVRECERIGARSPELKIIGDSVRLTIFAAPQGWRLNGTTD